MSITIEKGNKSYPPSNIQVLLCKDNEVLGEVNGYRVDMEYSEVDNSECYEEIDNLIERYPQVLDENGQPRIAELYQADIVQSFRGQGFGLQMYVEFMRRYWDEVSKGKPFIFIPNGCALDMEGSNSKDSARVWQSLGRKFPSSGSHESTCISVLKKPENMAQRVASRHIASLRQTTIKYEPYSESDWFNDYNANVGLNVLDGEEYIGQIEGRLSYVDLDEIETYDCVTDILDLYELWGNDVPSWRGGEKIPVFEIIGSDLDPVYQNKKIGLRMYKEIANLAREENSNPIFFIPNYCNVSSTSKNALRVWKSLTRSNSSTSSGDVVLMVERKLR